MPRTYSKRVALPAPKKKKAPVIRLEPEEDEGSFRFSHSDVEDLPPAPRPAPAPPVVAAPVVAAPVVAAPVADPDFQPYMRKVWSDPSIKRLCNFAQCKRIRADSYDTIRAALYSITSRICEKSFYIATKIDKVKTLLPRQIEFVCKSMKIECPKPEDKESIPGFQKAPFLRLVKKELGADLRVSNDALVLLMTVVKDIMYKWIRSAVMLKAHHDQITIDSRDLRNIKSICKDCVISKF